MQISRWLYGIPFNCISVLCYCDTVIVNDVWASIIPGGFNVRAASGKGNAGIIISIGMHLTGGGEWWGYAHMMVVICNNATKFQICVCVCVTHIYEHRTKYSLSESENFWSREGR